ncbi:MAG: hypothetical protein MJ228_01100 [Bacilli bacterium]|nr:hypothetical protein [Bacilli bacterium]
MIKNKLFNKIINIVLAVLTVVLGLLFIIQAIRLNSHYTKKLIAKVFLQILAIVILWAVVFVISMFTKSETKKTPAKTRYFKKIVSEKTYFIINIAYLVLILACAVFTIGYLVQKKHFSYEYNKDFLAFMYYLLPFVIILLVASLVRAAFVTAPKPKEAKTKSKKERMIVNGVRAGVILVALTFIVIGVLNKQAGMVLSKATMICLECIGIG